MGEDNRTAHMTFLYYFYNFLWVYIYVKIRSLKKFFFFDLLCLRFFYWLPVDSWWFQSWTNEKTKQSICSSREYIQISGLWNDKGFTIQVFSKQLESEKRILTAVGMCSSHEGAIQALYFHQLRSWHNLHMQKAGEGEQSNFCSKVS